MKSSGIEWIGDIPEDWEVKKLKYVAELDPTISKFLGDNDIVSFAPMECLGEQTLSPYETEYGKVKGKYTYFANEDIIMAKVTPCFENGNIAIAKNLKNNVAFGSSELFVFRAKNISNSFLMYSLYSEPFKSLAKSTMYGTGGLKRVSPEFILNYKIPFPPLKTQEKIADYLDEKCGEIDATITKQKESIEKLKAYKQSLISETVTKGLDKSAPIKPSGIEWIGDIPAHWEVCKIKNHCNLKTGSTPSSKDLSMFDGAENWFTPSDFTENYMLKNSLRRLNAKVFDQNLVPIFPPLSVLIVGIGATTGKVGFTTSKSSSNQQITAIIPKDKNIFPKFLLFWMIANTKMMRETALFTTLPILNNDTLGNATLLIPPYKEQLELASYIENKNIEIDVIINKKQNIIQKLDTYKKSLIFECVTGKMFNLRRNL